MINSIIFIPFWGSVLGAVAVFFIKKFDIKINKILYGISSGIMIAASIFSLIIPSLNYLENVGKIKQILPLICGLPVGFMFMILSEIVTEKLLNRFEITSENNNKFKNIKRCILFFIALTIHNIPEGMVVGVGLLDMENIKYVLSLAIGIGVQNIPEGLISSIPFKEETGSNKASFGLGVLSGAVEPVFAYITYMCLKGYIIIVPYLLCFAAGCMLYVVTKELIPNLNLTEEEKKECNSNIGILSFMVGFLIMTVLDVVLG